MNKTIEQLTQIRGVLAVAQLDADGDLMRLEGSMGGAQAQWLAKTVNALNALVDAQFGAWTMLGGGGFKDTGEWKGWVVAGPTYTVAGASSGVVCMLQNSEADFTRVIPAITGVNGTGPGRGKPADDSTGDEETLAGFEASITWDRARRSVETKGAELPAPITDLLIKGCLAILSVLNSQADDYTTLGGAGLERVTSFAVVARGRLLVVRKNRAVVIKTGEVDYNRVIKSWW